jgi:hypothetical protein
MNERTSTRAPESPAPSTEEPAFRAAAKGLPKGDAP